MESKGIKEGKREGKRLKDKTKERKETALHARVKEEKLWKGTAGCVK